MRFKILMFIFIITSSKVFSQFQAEMHTSGPSLGFSFLGSTVQLGINHEYGINLKNDNQEIIGKFGIGGIFRAWSYTEDFPEVEWSYSNILFGFQSNYHFKLKNEKLDPWAGLFIAYDFKEVNKEILVEGADISNSEKGGLCVGAQAGMRYWLNTKMAFSVRLGIATLNYSALDLGFDYSFK